MLARIAAYIAAAFSALGKATRWTFDVAWATARLPFELISTRPPAPNYTPTVEKSDVLDEYHQARALHQQKATVQSLNRDGIETLLDYCRAHQSDRPAMKLPQNLPAQVVATLISMDDASLRRLAKAGSEQIGQVRKFMKGEPHTIFGVPSVSNSPAASPDRTMSEQERLLLKIRERLLSEKQEQSRPFKMPIMR